MWPWFVVGLGPIDICCEGGSGRPKGADTDTEEFWGVPWASHQTSPHLPFLQAAQVMNIHVASILFCFFQMTYIELKKKNHFQHLIHHLVISNNAFSLWFQTKFLQPLYDWSISWRGHGWPEERWAEWLCVAPDSCCTWSRRGRPLSTHSPPLHEIIWGVRLKWSTKATFRLSKSVRLGVCLWDILCMSVCCAEIAASALKKEVQGI